MNNTLLIGSGGCGGKLLNVLAELMEKQIGLKCAYDFLFVNSNKNEMTILDYCKVGVNTLIINGDGTGKNREKAKTSIGNDKVNVMNRLDNIADKYNSAYILLSGDGGFGSGSINLLSKVLKQVNPEIVVNLLVAMPRTSSKRMSLENALSLYEDIKELVKQGLVNSYQFIDNNRMQDEEEFNLRTMSLFLESLEMGVEALDGNDSLIVNSAVGYKIILPISSKFNSMSDAIDKSIKNSPFVISDKNRCTHIYGVYDKDVYLYDDIFESYTVTEFDKIVAGDKTVMVMTGLGNPDKHMSILNEAYKELDSIINEGELEEEFSFKKKTKRNDTTNKTDEVNKKQRLRAMMDDDFWS